MNCLAISYDHILDLNMMNERWTIENAPEQAVSLPVLLNRKDGRVSGRSIL